MVQGTFEERNSKVGKRRNDTITRIKLIKMMLRLLDNCLSLDNKVLLHNAILKPI
jgi:hypothetical protein